MTSKILFPFEFNNLYHQFSERGPGILEGLRDPFKNVFKGFPGGAVVENLPANAGYTGSSPGLGGSHMPRSNWPREPQLLSLRV